MSGNVYTMVARQQTQLYWECSYTQPLTHYFPSQRLVWRGHLAMKRLLSLKGEMLKRGSHQKVCITDWVVSMHLDGLSEMWPLQWDLVMPLTHHRLPFFPQLSLPHPYHVGLPLDQQPSLSRTLSWLHQVKNNSVHKLLYLIDRLPLATSAVWVTCVKVVVVVSAESTGASVPGLKRPASVEETPSTKRRDIEEGTSPEGIVY